MAYRCRPPIPMLDVTANHVQRGTAMNALWCLLILYGIGYWTSLHLHPMIRCRSCKGTGWCHGAVFTYANRTCPICKGTRSVPRLGVRVFLGGANRR